MATLSATFFRDGFQHPVRAWKKQLSRRRPVSADLSGASGSSEQSAVECSVPDYGVQSPERLERIVAYARSGYFPLEYTAGMFVVPLDKPSE